MSETRTFRELVARGPLKVPAFGAQPGTAGAEPFIGSTVQRAQPLLEPTHSAPATLAPMAGLIGAPGTAVLTSGREVPSILIAPAGTETDHPTAPPTDGASRLQALLRDATPDKLSTYSDRLRLAGVWADRWTSPDLLGQLHQCLKRPVDTILCNALDFDDALPLQQTVTCTSALEIVTAVAVLAAVTGATRALVIVDAAVADVCVRAVERWAPQTGVRALPIRNDYPQPNPTLLLHTIARRQLRPGRLPTEAGVILLDALAAAAAGRALLYEQPALTTAIGIADMRVDRDGNAAGVAGGSGGSNAAPRMHLLEVPNGTSLADVLQQTEVAPGPFELRGGSPLREVRLPHDCVVSTGGEVALYLVAPQPTPNPDPCIRCGWCVSGCPVHIHPAGILQAAQAADPAAADRYGIESCIECGICSYVCPSYLPLLQGIRSMRMGS